MIKFTELSNLDEYILAIIVELAKSISIQNFYFENHKISIIIDDKLNLDTIIVKMKKAANGALSEISDLKYNLKKGSSWFNVNLNIDDLVVDRYAQDEKSRTLRILNKIYKRSKAGRIPITAT